MAPNAGKIWGDPALPLDAVPPTRSQTSVAPWPKRKRLTASWGAARMTGCREGTCSPTHSRSVFFSSPFISHYLQDLGTLRLFKVEGSDVRWARRPLFCQGQGQGSGIPAGAGAGGSPAAKPLRGTVLWGEGTRPRRGPRASGSPPLALPRAPASPGRAQVGPPPATGPFAAAAASRPKEFSSGSC